MEADRGTDLPQLPEFATQSQSDRVNYERTKHEKDVLQPWTTGNKVNVDFAKAYPSKLKDYFTQDQLKGL